MNMAFRKCSMICIISIMITVGPVAGQMLDGCSLYGCQPTGTFSMDVALPRDNVTVDWVSHFFLGPVPQAGGCVGNSAGLVCQSNGPGPADTGYMGISMETGSVTWRDPILRFPSLPVMDAKGNIWGSDGSNLMRYDVTGKPLSSNVRLNPQMHPIFSLQLIDTGDLPLLLFVSENGHIAITLTDGTPFASIVLRGIVERSNGTFKPTSAPVANDNRFYLMTEFVPDDDQSQILGLQRLYAFDTKTSMTDRLTVAWYANFEREQCSLKPITGPRAVRNRSTVHSSDTDLLPSLLFDKAVSTIYLSLPPPAACQKNVPGDPSFRALKDDGDHATPIYQTELSVVNMVLYDGAPGSNAGRQLWVSTEDQRLIALKHDGNISHELDLKGLLNSNFTITSKITVTRLKLYEEDFLLFGVTLHSESEALVKMTTERFGIERSKAKGKNFIVCIDTPENSDDVDPDRVSKGGMPLAWMIPTPDDTVLSGQIVGMNADGHNAKNRIVAFSQIEGKFGKIFSIA